MEFPEIHNGQFAVIHAEKATGVVLDTNGSRNLGLPNEWAIFDSLGEAENYCDLKIADHPMIECNIYNHLQEKVKTVS